MTSFEFLSMTPSSKSFHIIGTTTPPGGDMSHGGSHGLRPLFDVKITRFG